MPSLYPLELCETKIVEENYPAGLLATTDIIAPVETSNVATNLTISGSVISGVFLAQTLICSYQAIGALSVGGVSGALVGGLNATGVAASAGGIIIGGALLAAALGLSIAHLRTIQVVIHNPTNRSFCVCDIFRDVGNLTYPVEIPAQSIVSHVWHHQGPSVGSYIVYREKDSNEPFYLVLGASNPFVGKNKLYICLSRNQMSANEVDKKSTKWKICKGPVSVSGERYDNPSTALVKIELDKQK